MFEGVKRWWMRRRHGFVAAPRGSGGTSWQEHGIKEVGFTCRCGVALAFGPSNLVIREREHIQGCFAAVEYTGCDCPITDARFVLICPACRLGHWRQAGSFVLQGLTKGEK